MRYRKEIDGLRALAVVPVIFFHAGFSQFGGGYVGVDVFFVISGYLITSIIISEQDAGTFTLPAFYERRARRILPALLLVLLACLPFAWLWMVPSDMRRFSQSLFAISVFGSNFYFWLKSGYFDTSAHLAPLLHTWSLAVEEQFYLLFPVILLLASRFGKRWLASMLTIVAVASFSAAQWGSIRHPVPTFYLLPTRGWELLIGALVALYLSGWKPETKTPKPGRIVREAAGLAGLLSIAYATFTFNRTTPFPGIHALVPTIGTALIILFANAGTLVGKLLGTRPLVSLGLISYGTYLWHYPLFAFARLRNSDETTVGMYLLLILSSIGLACLSWKYVELPFRDRRRTGGKLFLSLALFFSAILAAFGLGGHFTAGFPQRLSPEQQELAAFVEYDRVPIYRDGRCFLMPAQSFRDFTSECSAVRQGAPIYLIWGDSFAAALSGGFRYFKPNVIQYTASSCAPIIGIDFSNRPRCREINEFILGEAGRTRPEIIILHALWYSYTALEVNEAGIANTISEIRRLSPDSRILIVGSLPMWSKALPEVLMQNEIRLNAELFARTPMLDDMETVDKRLRRMASANGVEFLSALESSCKGRTCQVVTRFKGVFQPTAWDIGHLTEGGSVLLVGKLLPQIEERPRQVAK